MRRDIVPAVASKTGNDSAVEFVEFRQGWKPLMAAFVVGVFVTLGYNTMGSLLNPLSIEFGWNFGEIQVALIGYGAIVAIGALIVGPFCDRFGARPIALFGAAGFGLSFAALSLTSSLISFYLLYMLLGLTVTGLTSVVFTHTINQWFVRRRGLALGILTSSAGVANLVIPSLTVALISKVGWRGTYASLGLSALAIGLPLLAIYFHAPKQQAKVGGSALPFAAIPYRELLRTRAFSLTCISAIAIGLAYAGVWTNLQSILGERGFDRSHAAAIAGLTGPAIIVGRLASGFLLDKIRAPLVALPLFSLTAIACFLLAQGYSAAPIVICAVMLVGGAIGAEGDAMPFVIGRYIGFRHYGAAFGMAYAAYQFSVSISPAFYGYVFHFYRTYTLALYTSAVLFIAAAISMILLGPYPTLTNVPSHREAGREL